MFSTVVLCTFCTCTSFLAYSWRTVPSTLKQVFSAPACDLWLAYVGDGQHGSGGAREIHGTQMIGGKHSCLRSFSLFLLFFFGGVGMAAVKHGSGLPYAPLQHGLRCHRSPLLEDAAIRLWPIWLKHPRLRADSICCTPPFYAGLVYTYTVCN